MKISFENKVALVTGAATGTSFATAKGFAEAWASAVLWRCSDASSFVVGHALVVDGGFTAH